MLRIHNFSSWNAILQEGRETAKLLIQKGADVNQTNSYHLKSVTEPADHPLILMAIYRDSIDMVRVLIDRFPKNQMCKRFWKTHQA